MIVTFVIEPERFMQCIIFLIAKTAVSREAKFQLHYEADWPQI